jgi:malto-oligosyltrehalose trehalohydrolase
MASSKPISSPQLEELNYPSLDSKTTRIHRMPTGADIQPDGKVRFRVWAPAAGSLALSIEGTEKTVPFLSQAGGWHELVTSDAKLGTLYRLKLPSGTLVPDPASRFQPQDVHGPSEVIDPSDYQWKDSAWRGRPWSDAVLYELHIGAFTEEGTFLSAMQKLDHLVQLGVTAIEIMPVADFPGKRNWGYDGVLLYAPDSSYGRPEDFKALVEAAHLRGLMVILDVVYNHFGPEGNCIPSYAPEIFTDHHKTPWGDAVNYDSEGSEVVREFIIHNALYWIEEFNLDGLRLDAVHAIKDDSPKHLLDELAERVRAATRSRPVHLLLENEDNQASRLTRDEHSEPISFTAQWNDDMHHVLHTAATLESNGYYGDYKDDTEKLGRALAEGFAFQGEVMQARKASRGEPSAHLPPGAFVAFMQNHDQIGNRAFGERISSIAPPEAVHAIGAVYLLLPQTPMLFMGEEWGSSQPFPFFCDFSGDLGELVRQGRREEFAKFPEFQDPDQRERIPDPLAGATFQSAKLDWAQSKEGVHAEWLDWYRRILEVRKRFVIPHVREMAGHAGIFKVIGTGAVVVRFRNINGSRELVLAANLSNDSRHDFPLQAGHILWREGARQEVSLMRPWSVYWSLQELTEK